MMTQTVSKPARHQPAPGPWTRESLAQAGRDAAYLLISWPLMLAGFLVTITLVAAGAGTVVVWVGLPILFAGLMVARGFATMERRVSAALTGREPTTVNYKLGGQGWRAMLRPLADPQSWLDVLWLFAGVIVSGLTWALALTWVVGTLATVLGPMSVLILDTVLPKDNYNGLGDLLSLPFATAFDVVSQFTLGLVFALTAPFVLRRLAGLQTSLSDLLLNSRSRQEAKLSHLSESRAAVRMAETDALRRLERDIHDGPQQRLVRLSMDLARAKRQAATNPEQAQAMIAEAMTQTQETLAELRRLSRGIAPPVLVDRGLEAAISEAATRSLVPVSLFLDLPTDPRLPMHVETAAYFVVSEALANINKHSDASAAQVVAGVQDQWLFLTITDDGIGGASPAKGHGLAGLAERLKGVDATVSVTSPEGGPTSIEAVIPCTS